MGGVARLRHAPAGGGEDAPYVVDCSSASWANTAMQWLQQLMRAMQPELHATETLWGPRLLASRAVDADAGENARISYSLANIDAEELPFEIDHFTGVIKSNKLIDYEADRREYVLHVRASDWGTPFRRQAEIKVKIHIKDVNDNRPQVGNSSGFQPYSRCFTEG